MKDETMKSKSRADQHIIYRVVHKELHRKKRKFKDVFISNGNIFRNPRMNFLQYSTTYKAQHTANSHLIG